MKKLFTLLTLIPVLAFAQSDTAHAYFKKGIEDELDFIAQKFIITKYASENNLIGQPSISFIINEAGRTEGFKIKESGGTEYDWELIRVIRTMKYRPAKINGQKISEWRTLTFNIDTIFLNYASGREEYRGTVHSYSPVGGFY